MRVKTPQFSSGKNPRRTGQKMQLVSTNSAQKHNRPTTAAGACKYDSNDLMPAKGRRFLGSAKPCQRRNLRSKNNLKNVFDKGVEEGYSSHQVNTISGSIGNQMHDFTNHFHESDQVEEGNFHQPDLADRPPSRQKEPSLALGIGSEYGEDIADDDPGNKISSEIILTTGIPAPLNDFPSKYTPAQARRGVGIDLRPPSRQKTPTKAVCLDDRDVSANKNGNGDVPSTDNDEYKKAQGKRRKNYVIKGRGMNKGKQQIH